MLPWCGANPLENLEAWLEENDTGGLACGMHIEVPIPFIEIHCNSLGISPGAKLENGGLPYTKSPLSFDGFN